MSLDNVHLVDITAARIADMSAAPAVIAPLVEAAKHGGDLVSAVTTIVQSLGFDNFAYGLSTVFRPGHDSIVHTFTTAPQKWALMYHERAYIEIDPRIEHAVGSTLPHVWDQATERGKSARLDEFLDNAASYGGICSGVSFLLPDSNRASVILCLNSSQTPVTDTRRQMLVENFGAMFAFGYYFHELFMRNVIDAGLPSVLEGAPLTVRERECLALAANGLTTEEIAERLTIKPRTAQFHFDSVRTKLAVATRSEAIARAIQQRLIKI